MMGEGVRFAGTYAQPVFYCADFLFLYASGETAASEFIELSAAFAALLAHSCKASPWRLSSTRGVTFAAITVLGLQDNIVV